MHARAVRKAVSPADRDGKRSIQRLRGQLFQVTRSRGGEDGLRYQVCTVERGALFELQAWPGHGSPNSAQQDAKISPATPTKAYRDAGYFERNVRTIEVLIDRDAAQNGTAAAGEPWQYLLPRARILQLHLL
jgi:hypothetical protein